MIRLRLATRNQDLQGKSMTAKTAFSTSSATEIRFERRFAADCDTIWANWTEAKHLQKWWGPDGWTTPVCEMDFRVGGSWFYCMQGPNDMKSSGRATFQATDAPRSISYVDIFTDEQGAAIEGMPEAHTLIEFAESEGVDQGHWHDSLRVASISRPGYRNGSRSRHRSNHEQSG